MLRAPRVPAGVQNHNQRVRALFLALLLALAAEAGPTARVWAGGSAGSPRGSGPVLVRPHAGGIVIGGAASPGLAARAIVVAPRLVSPGVAVVNPGAPTRELVTPQPLVAHAPVLRAPREGGSAMVAPRAVAVPRLIVVEPSALAGTAVVTPPVQAPQPGQAKVIVAPTPVLVSSRTVGAKIVGDSGFLLVDVAPLDAEVFLDGRRLGLGREVTAQVFVLAVGRHTIEIVAPGFQPLTAEIALSPGSPTRFRAILTSE